MNFAKLITEKESLTRIEKEESIEDLKLIFLDPMFKELVHILAKDICQAKLDKPHFYRIKIQVHAQEVSNED